MKKVLSLFLSLILLLSITTSINFSVYATSKTADEAISWVKSQLGSTVGTGQCVALINSYYSFLGVSPVNGNGCDYSTNSLPNGWTRTKGGIPQKGDILVYNANSSNPFGHVGIYEGDYSHYHQNVNGQYVEQITEWKFDGFSNSYWGCIHPNFSGSIGKATNLKAEIRGGILRLLWSAADGANCYDVIMTKPDGNVEYLHSSGTSKDIRNLSYGVYKFDVQSLYRPDGSTIGQIVGPHSDVLTVDYNMQSVTNVKIERTGTTIQLTWDVADGANCYDVIVKDPKGNTDWYHSDTNSKTFTNCIPGKYVYDIQSLYRPNGSTVNQKVGPHSGDYAYEFVLEAPNNLNVLNDKDDNLVVEWDLVDGATCYDVIIKKTDGNTDYLHTHTNKKVIPYYDFGTYEIDVQSLYRENEGTTSQFQVVGNHSKKITYEYKKTEHQHTVTIDKAVAPTCTKTGLSEGKHCSECGKIIIEQTIVSMLTHSYKTTTTKATTIKDGSVVTKCSVCGAVKSKSTIYCPKTVTLSATSYTYDGKVKKPSVKVVGSNGKTISSSNYTVSYASGRKYVGKYAVKITFKGNYSGTKTLYFYIKPKSTSISSLTAGSKKFTVKWKKQATQTTGYQIQYSTSSKFTNAKTVTVGKNSTTSKTISKLKAKKKYYVRIRTYKTVGKAKYYSAWSKAKAVTIKR